MDSVKTIAPAPGGQVRAMRFLLPLGAPRSDSGQRNAASTGSFEMVGCDPDADPKAKSDHQRGEDDSMNDLRPLPPNQCYAPLASALLPIESDHPHNTPRSMGRRTSAVRPPSGIQNERVIWPVMARGVT